MSVNQAACTFRFLYERVLKQPLGGPAQVLEYLAVTRTGWRFGRFLLHVLPNGFKRIHQTDGSNLTRRTTLKSVAITT